MATVIEALMYSRRDTAANWTAADPILGPGELGIETDTLKFKFGDGTTVWSLLDYAVNLDALAPAGGSAAQVLTKDSGTDYDYSWTTLTSTKTINAQTGTSYQLVLSDADRNAFLTLSNAGAVTLTIPTNATVAFPVGSVIEGANLNTGDVTITPAGGVTVNGAPGLKISDQYGVFGLLKLATNTWIAYGRLST